MQAKSVIIQDNWQVAPSYKKSWQSVAKANSVDEAIRLLLQRRTQGKQQEVLFFQHTHLKIWKARLVSLPISPSFFSQVFSSKSGNPGYPQQKIGNVYTSQIRSGTTTSHETNTMESQDEVTTTNMYYTHAWDKQKIVLHYNTYSILVIVRSKTLIVRLGTSITQYYIIFLTSLYF